MSGPNVICGFKLTVQTDEHGHEHKTFECSLPHDHAGRYGERPIIEHRQGTFQWMEHALSMAELIGLKALERMSDRAGIPGLSDDLIEGKATVAKLASFNYVKLEGGMWRITDLGREVLRARLPW